MKNIWQTIIKRVLLAVGSMIIGYLIVFISASHIKKEYIVLPLAEKQNLHQMMIQLDSLDVHYNIVIKVPIEYEDRLPGILHFEKIREKTKDYRELSEM